jgi:DnaJ-class molecular chaperone
VRRLNLTAEALSAVFQIDLAPLSAPVDATLEPLCEQCHGLGKLYGHDPPLDCFGCHGTGLEEHATTPAQQRARALTRAIRLSW